MAKKHFKVRFETEQEKEKEKTVPGDSVSASSIQDPVEVEEELNVPRTQVPENVPRTEPVHSSLVSSSSSPSVSVQYAGPSTSSWNPWSGSIELPLDLRTDKRSKEKVAGEEPTGSKINTLFSDVDPIATQIYLQVLQKTQKSARASFSPPSTLEGQPVSVREQRRIHRNVAEQLTRDEEKYQEYWMLVQVHQMEKRNLALNAALEELEAEKARLLGYLADNVDRPQPPP